MIGTFGGLILGIIKKDFIYTRIIVPGGMVRLKGKSAVSTGVKLTIISGGISLIILRVLFSDSYKNTLNPLVILGCIIIPFLLVMRKYHQAVKMP